MLKIDFCKKLSLVCLFFLGSILGANGQTMYAGPDTTNCGGMGIQIGSNDACMNCCYKWSPSMGLDDDTKQQPTANPMSTTEYSVTVTGDKFSMKATDMVKVFVVTSATFKEDMAQDYGYDDNTVPATHWKSVEVGQNDPVTVEIMPNADDSYKGVYYKSVTEARVTVNPDKATAATHALQVSGVAKGTSEVQANCGRKDGDNFKKVNVAAYTKVTKTVGIRLVHEDNDDVQLIPVGQGQPNQVCITAGVDAMLDSAPGGDDVMVGMEINTGPDGVCNTVKMGDDVQVIPNGNGKPNVDCVGIGVNAYRDSNTAMDDVAAGNNMPINTGPDGICNSPANNTDIMSTDAATAAVTNYLNNTVYNQAVCEWTVTRLPTITTNFDLNRDGQIDDSTWMTAEMAALRDSSDAAGYDNVLFFVDNPSFGGFGFMSFNQKYGFINGDNSPDMPTTCAHELGHGAWGLTHGSGNGVGNNIMTQGQQNKWRLFKGQWDSINP